MGIKSASVLDQPESVIASYLASTGLTREELEKSVKESNERAANPPELIDGTNPDLAHKFTADTGYEVLE